eukprot:1469022-Pleurochrysis_carterae.AAC.2
MDSVRIGALAFGFLPPRENLLLLATINLTNSRALTCSQWLGLARAHVRVRTRMLVFENELITEPYRPTQ